ncbi:hypothetical protein SDC9_131458 [bioreactor metagenome]|uniref:Uncharacterized protein n=1 Tax=bioreactor metagenome TaxID=1076179 RepID=A0A645D5A4_9ZZZZ
MVAHPRGHRAAADFFPEHGERQNRQALSADLFWHIEQPQARSLGALAHLLSGGVIQETGRVQLMFERDQLLLDKTAYGFAKHQQLFRERFVGGQVEHRHTTLRDGVKGENRSVAVCVCRFMEGFRPGRWPVRRRSRHRVGAAAPSALPVRSRP